LPKVVTQRCLEQHLNPRPTDRKPKWLTVAPPRHLCAALKCTKRLYYWKSNGNVPQCPIAGYVNDRKLSDIKLSQGSVATRLTSDGIFSNYFTVNLPPNLPCQERKSKIDRTGKNTYIDIFFSARNVFPDLHYSTSFECACSL